MGMVFDDISMSWSIHGQTMSLPTCVNHFWSQSCRVGNYNFAPFGRTDHQALIRSPPQLPSKLDSMFLAVSRHRYGGVPHSTTALSALCGSTYCMDIKSTLPKLQSVLQLIHRCCGLSTGYSIPGCRNVASPTAIFAPFGRTYRTVLNVPWYGDSAAHSSNMISPVPSFNPAHRYETV